MTAAAVAPAVGQGALLEDAVVAGTPPTRPSPDLRIIGLDLSLTATGIASVGWTDTLCAPDELRDHRRLKWIRDAVADHTRTAELVIVEGPSYASPSQSQTGHHERAGLWWLITHQLWRARMPFAVVTPKGRAKYATGNGNAGKSKVVAAVARRFFDYPLRNDNEADALVLAAMGYDHYGYPLVEMPAKNRDALKAVTWPDLERVI